MAGPAKAAQAGALPPPRVEDGRDDEQAPLLLAAECAGKAVGR
jgi:hypothetical protein